LAKDTGTQVEYTDNQRYQIAPSLLWKPSENTSLFVQLNLQKDETDGATAAFPPHRGTIIASANGKIPLKRFTGEPGIDQTHMDNQDLNWQFEHAFNDTWTVRQNGRYSNMEYDYVSLYPNIFLGVGVFDSATVTRSAYINQAKTRTFSLDNSLQVTFDIANTKHTLIGGIDYFKSRIDEKNGFTTITTPFNLFDPVYGNFNPAELPVAIDQPDNSTDQIGFYIQDQMKVGKHWAFTAGLRRDETNKKTQGVSGQQTDRATTGRIGVVYLADNGLAPYASYTESFTPVIGMNPITNQLYQPMEGKQKEVGVRYQPEESNSMYTFSLYDLELENVLSPGPGGTQIQGGKTKSRGFEVEALANLTDNIDLIANYTYTKARRDNALTDAGGNLLTDTRIAEVRDNTASVWATYKFSIAGISGFKVGAGVRYLSDSKDETSTLELPSVTLFDAMFAYENKDWRAAINGTNLGDKVYFATCLSRGDCWYANRMNIVGSLTYKF
jgi:iron complex outermembrane receptor protein